jgi:hypothetical protein
MKNVRKVATPKPVAKTTHSFRLFSCLQKQGGVATTVELAKAAGLKIWEVAWYMAEMRRVYGVQYEHKHSDKYYYTPNLEGISIPSTGLRGRKVSAPVVARKGGPQRAISATQVEGAFARFKSQLMKDLRITA